VKRNPNFEARGGKVSVLAHSLGAVITYDIMTGYISPLRSDCPELRSIELNGVDQSEEINHEGILVIDDITSDEMPEQPRLLFKLEHFFCLGSPLAVFLALRWKEPHNPDLRSYILPPTLCKRVYNVFHPSDPVAYRLEPLLSKSYVKIAPLVIHPTGSSTKPKYDEMEKELISREPTTQQQPHPSAKSDDIFGGNFGPTSQSSSLRSTPQRFNATNANVTSGPPSSSLSMAANLKSPPTPSKDSNWSWFNLMKYWKTPESNPEFSQTSSMGSPPGFQELGHQVIPGRSPRIPDVDAEVQFHSLPPGPRNDEFVPDTSMGEETFLTATAASVPPIPNDLEYRMDYVLRESNLSSSYLAALTSHTAYWNTPDVAFFVLTHLYNGSLEQVDNH
jgi:phospholipase DDHD1